MELDDYTISEVVKFLRKEANWLRQNYTPQSNFPVRISVFTTINQIARKIELKDLTEPEGTKI